MKSLLPLLLCLQFLSANAQTNVRAWYADGQVWVVWETTSLLPETFAIYSKSTAFTNTADAVLVGRLFKEEYSPFALREQVDSSATYRIPNGQGGTYELTVNEGLFVATPHQAGSAWFAVVPWGQTQVTGGVNITKNAVSFQYNPTNDPVECHLQKSFLSPFDQDYVCFAFYMWADGRQNQWENRPDFPVMANAAKNGMPSLFLISVPNDIDTTKSMPLTVWLHGGGGSARQSLAGSRQEIRLNPKQGILVAHNDDLFGKLLTFYSGTDGVSKHFGWRKNYDPFTGEAATTIDTIVNYTQRRYFWIDQWLIRHFNIDSTRININGHSMGSRGATLMAKTFPAHYATATVLNNGFQDDDPPALIDVVFGLTALNFPTNLKGYDGQTIHYSRAMNLDLRLSTARDLPLIRSFHGKNDVGGGNEWDAYVVEQYRAADSIGWGAQLYWSERKHGPDTGPDYNDHWISGIPITQQTAVDDISYEEDFRSNQSFPAFFNHRLDAKNNDPGDGTPGTGANGVGDDWGTWGGYHRWENTQENAVGWQTTAWLESNAVFANDNCPNNFLTADVAIRKPQQFKPAAGTVLNWNVKDLASGAMLQSGTTTVRADSLVVLPKIVVFKENIRKVRILVVNTSVATQPEPVFAEMGIKIVPNPSVGNSNLTLFSQKVANAEIRAISLTGNTISFKTQLAEGENRISLSKFYELTAGFYVVEIIADGQRKAVKWVKL
ncbi:MAG: T9SS type A sorting domain-containing protein [Saprospiraceae bacterium]|nr:T9SS type A sorting domain-containing protein [Saprospiraceae bacterium]